MSDHDDRRGVFVPSFVVIIAAGLVTGAVAGLAAFVVDTREDVVRLETRVETVQAATNGVATVPAQLATLSTQMTQVQKDLTALSVKLENRGRK